MYVFNVLIYIFIFENLKLNLFSMNNISKPLIEIKWKNENNFFLLLWNFYFRA